jgi:hypothetical protein
VELLATAPPSSQILLISTLAILSTSLFTDNTFSSSLSGKAKIGEDNPNPKPRSVMLRLVEAGVASLLLMEVELASSSCCIVCRLPYPMGRDGMNIGAVGD